MDIKLKNNRQNRVFGIILCAILIAAISACATASYPFILKNAERLTAVRSKNEALEKDEEKTYYKSRFIKTLYMSNYVLYINSKRQTNAGLNPSQIFLSYSPQEISENILYDDEYEYFADQFNEAMESWYNNFYSETLEDLPSFKYYFINNNTKYKLTNSIDPLHVLMEDTDEAKDLKASYPFYIVFRYTEDGSLQILDYAGLEQELIDEYKLLELNKSAIQDEINDSWWYKYKDRIRSLTNATIIYASDSEEFYLPQYISLYRFSPVYTFSDAGLALAAVIAAACVILMAVLLPLKKSWGIGNGLSSKIPAEASLAALALSICLYNPVLSMAWETARGYLLVDPAETIIPGKVLNIMDNCFNFAVWFTILTIIFVSLLSLRQFFTLGPKRYIKEKSLIGRFFKWAYDKIRKLIHSLGQIDLSDPSNKSIIKILAVNFVILLVMCSIWVFGIFLLIIYSIILFFILRKYFDDIKKKYSLLLNGTIRIAEGNLDYTIEEDLGIFEPLKDELTKVQKGFRKAVEEEMKSQRMKADLITNVSHDLKTPLTAIITYVNLLKDENISEEDRKSYIETLDKKSQRLKRLIDDLFEISKATSNNITLEPVDVDLTDLIKQVLLEMDDKIKESGIDFRFNHPEKKIILKLDSEKTYRIFENLIINIVKYGMPNTRAYIDIANDGNTVRTTIKNVSASELNFNAEEISERFVRGDQSRNTDGSGLGLAIVKSFVELQGGQFRIETDGDLFKAIIEWKI